MSRNHQRLNHTVLGRISSEPKNMSSSDINNTTALPTLAGDQDYDSLAYFSPEADIFPLLLALLIIIVNTWVIALVSKKSVLRNITNYILCSLAVSDLLTGYFSIPMFVACNVIRKAPICLTSDVFLRFTSISTVAHLLAVTGDRYLAIIHSLRYSMIVTRFRAFLALLVIWITSVFMSLVHFAWLNPTTHDVYATPSQEQKMHEIRYDIFCLISYFVFPFFFMIFAYGSIFYQVIRQRKIIARNNTPSYWKDPGALIDRNKWKAAVIFVVMLMVYMCCWMPYFLYRLQFNYRKESIKIPISVQYLIVYLRFCTSLFNPLLYILGKQDFRKVIITKYERRTSRLLGTSTTKATFV